ncbi:MAG: B12-binding domain-containing radical SAM protein [Myxococcota bacterium]
MADILFIMPRIGYMDSKRSSPALPLSVLSAVNLVSREYSIKILDMRISHNPVRELIEELKNKPVLVASTCWTGPMIKDVVKMLKIVKEFGDIPVVLGGVHPTLLPEQTISSPYVDFIVSGEGELALLGLVKIIKNSGSIDSIPNLYYKQNGAVKFTYSGEPLDLDKLPSLPYKLIDIKRHLPLYQGRRSISYESSRGCPFKCKYCYQAPFNRQRVRFMSPERVIADVLNLRQKYGVEDIYFIDDNFYIDIERGIEIAKGLMKSDITYQIQGVDIITLSKMDDKQLDLLEKSGLKRITIGIETGSMRLRKYLLKKGDIETIIEVIKRLAKRKIIVYCSFFGGYPQETLEDIRMSIDLILKLIEINPNVRISPYYIYIPFPGTELYQEIVNKGLFIEPVSFESWGEFSWEDNPYINTFGKEKAEFYRRLYLLTLFADDKYKEYEYSLGRKTLAFIYHNIALFRLKYFFFNFMPEMMFYKYILKD